MDYFFIFYDLFFSYMIFYFYYESVLIIGIYLKPISMIQVIRQGMLKEFCTFGVLISRFVLPLAKMGYGGSFLHNLFWTYFRDLYHNIFFQKYVIKILQPEYSYFWAETSIFNFDAFLSSIGYLRPVLLKIVFKSISII